MSDRPLVVAANRLPVRRTDDGWAASPGANVRALLPLIRETGGRWVGWTGVPDDPAGELHVDGVDLHAVQISGDELAGYYEGFSNDTLWPLYHDAIRESGFHEEEWGSYVAVNERFATTIADVAPDGAVVWVHDYHLQLVPALLRDLRSDVRIGFFNHIPFPPSELFSRLPWRREIVEGLLGADLVGFQSGRGARNFAEAAGDLIGAHVDPTIWREGAAGVVEHGDRTVEVGPFPISIDVAEFEELAAGRAARQRSSSIRARLGEPEVILLGVDRLDYTKGIGSRMRAFGTLLDQGRLDPERHVLVQVATPTREGVDHYREERHDIEQIVGEINGRHARLGYPVIHYLYRTLPLDELVPLYRAGDVMLVTPFRDGMNLVAKEYVATRLDDDGVLVLSEFTGASDELTTAVLVNPHDETALQDAIVEAVEMHRHERRDRMVRLREVIHEHDVSRWASNFLEHLAG
ncbi:MAG: trehalose-6-phosphate synthase [Ilumatobacteraceae bacterium]